MALEAEAIRATVEGRLFEEAHQASKIDRFVILARAGAGAMGVVYRAYDPKLQREVALKLVRARATGVHASPARTTARLLREARAAARIAHPNVVPVYEVGVVEAAVFVAMEFVEGVTLREWIGQRRRPWAEVLAVLIAAGRGLQAAHRVGVVHRDFKPDNVLIGKDGRPRVADFGLARASTDVTATEDGGRVEPAVVATVTQTGSVLGTPLYMSPEQRASGQIDARSDQFSYCVAVWEALWGRRPYPEDEIESMCAAVAAGCRVMPRDLLGVPRGVLAILERGLHPDPARRFAEMDPLLAALERQRLAPRTVRQRWAVATALVIAASTGALGYAHMGRGAGVPGPCEGASAVRETVWNDVRRTAIKRRFAQAELAFAEKSAARTLELLDAYGGAWEAMHTDACEATFARHEQSEGLLDRKMACLRHRLGQFDAFATALVSAEQKGIEDAVAGAEALPSLSECAELERLSTITAVPADPLRRSALDVAETTIARARALEWAGQYPTALSLAESGAALAIGAAHPPIEAEAWNSVGRLRQLLGQRDADAAFESAFVSALAGGADTQAVRAAVGMMPVLDAREDQRTEARVWNERAKALIERLGGDGALESDRLAQLARIELAGGNVRAAILGYQQAIELSRRLERTPLERASMSLQLARAQIQAGAYGEAQTSLELALAVFESELGASHPRLAKVYGALGALAGRRDDHVDAYRWFERALGLLERSLGEHEATAGAHANLGSAARFLGRNEHAQAQMELALQMFEDTVGPQSRQVAGLLANLGNLAVAQGQHDRAIAYYDRALAHPANPHRDHALEGLAGVYQAEGEFDRALALLAECRRMREEAGRADLAIQSQMHIGSVLLDAGRLVDSLRVHRGALTAMIEADLPDHIHRGDANFGIGEALVRLGRHRQAIVALEEALATWARSPNARASEVAKAEVRLAEAQRGLATKRAIKTRP